MIAVDTSSWIAFLSGIGGPDVAQSCVDHGVALITRDWDFRNFARVAELQLLP